MRTIASVGSWIEGSGTSSTRTSRLPWKVSAFIVAPFASPLRSRGHAERDVRAVPARGDALRRPPLLDEDLLRRGDHLLVARPRGHPLQQFVGGHLEVLEGEGEAGQLGRRVRLGGEEEGEVEATGLESRVLDYRGPRPTLAEQRLEPLGVVMGLLQVLAEDRLELLVVDPL